jgi:hypothetical protein
MIEKDVGLRRAVTVPCTSTPWSFPQPLIGMAQSVMRYFYSYALDPTITSSLLSRGKIHEMAKILAFGGIKYLIVDEYSIEQDYVLSILNNSKDFSYIAQIGKLHVFEVKDAKDMIFTAYPICVLGGMETYNKILAILNNILNESSFAPIFLDGPIELNILDFPTTIISSPHKSILDLTASLLISSNRTITLPLSEYTKKSYPYYYWSPGFVLDTHHGIWTLYLPQTQGYEWEYSYKPDYGYIFTSASDELSLMFSISETGSYDVLIRVLMHPWAASIKIQIDDIEIPINTRWSSQYTEFVWMRIGKFNLKSGQHRLSIINQWGTNAINLMLLSPSDEIQRMTEAAKDFLGKTGNIILAASNLNDFEVYHDTAGTAEVTLNVERSGLYSILIRIINQDDSPASRNDMTNIKVVIENRTYETKILTESPLVILAKDVFLEEGQQSIKILPIAPNLVNNPSFEVLSDIGQNMVGWRNISYEPIFNIDNSTAWDGMNSLRIINNSTISENGRKAISNEISVESGDVLVIEAHMKAENVLMPQIDVEYLNNSKIPFHVYHLVNNAYGSFEWSGFKAEIKVPINATSLRIVLRAGSILDKSKGSSITWFDCIKIYKKPTYNYSILVYGPKGSLADREISSLAKQSSRAFINTLYINPLDWNYREYNVSLTINSSILLVIPDLYTGTMTVSIENYTSRIRYLTFPIYNVFTGIWINSENVSLPCTLTMTIYKEDACSYQKDMKISLMSMGTLLIIGIITDILMSKMKEKILDSMSISLSLFRDSYMNSSTINCKNKRSL